jgi:hypothetical protein
MAAKWQTLPYCQLTEIFRRTAPCNRDRFVSERSKHAFPKRRYARRQGHRVAQLHGHDRTIDVIVLHDLIVDLPPCHARGIDIAPDLRALRGTIVTRTEVPARHSLDIVHENATEMVFATQNRGHLIQGLTTPATGWSEPANEKRPDPKQDQSHEADG